MPTIKLKTNNYKERILLKKNEKLTICCLKAQKKIEKTEEIISEKDKELKETKLLSETKDSQIRTLAEEKQQLLFLNDITFKAAEVISSKTRENLLQTINREEDLLEQTEETSSEAIILQNRLHLNMQDSDLLKQKTKDWRLAFFALLIANLICVFLFSRKKISMFFSTENNNAK